MIFVTRRPGIVGSQKAGRTVAIQQLAEIGSTGQYVVVRVIWIGAEAVAGTQSGPRLRHDLHQAHGSLGRQSPHVAEAFDLHDGAYPRRRNAKPLRPFGDHGADWIVRRGNVVLLGGNRFGMNQACDGQQRRRRKLGWLIAQIGRLIGAQLPLHDDIDVPAVVTVIEDATSGGQFWTRMYGRSCSFPQVVHSSKRFAGPTGLEEYLGHGFGIALSVGTDTQALHFYSDHYFLTVGRRRMRLPRWAGPSRTAWRPLCFSP